MFGLSIKVAAFMLFSILMVHGKIYREDKYLMDSNHVERYRRLYSDDGSDVFDNADGTFNFDVPNLETANIGRAFPHKFPGFTEDNDEHEDDPIGEDSDIEEEMPNVFPVEDKRLDLDEPRSFDFDLARGLPHMYPTGNNQARPSWFPTDVNDDMRPSWFPGGIGDAGNNYPSSKPSRGDMKRKCLSIKGLPTPDSGCCGVQMTRPPVEGPNQPWWPQVPQYPGGRFTRSADKDTLPSGMISGGKATDLHQYPWMVRLSIDTTVSGIGTPKSCGGTIISSRYVLTAAHCLHGTFKNLKQLSVILAEYNSDTFPKDCNGQGCVMNKISYVDHIIMHPKFNSTFLHNDVALLRLSESINYSDYVRPICLPAEDIKDLSKKPLIIAGWGLNGRTESNLKRSAIVNYVTDDECQEEYSYKEDSRFCSIGSNGEDICHGDSGGPLMVHSDGKFFLSGIVNGKRKTEECGSKVPSLFNNVFYHLKWIKSHVQ